jgi:hypothetical protein
VGIGLAQLVDEQGNLTNDLGTRHRVKEDAIGYYRAMTLAASCRVRDFSTEV